jgi:hypothetical protein
VAEPFRDDPDVLPGAQHQRGVRVSEIMKPDCRHLVSAEVTAAAGERFPEQAGDRSG